MAELVEFKEAAQSFSILYVEDNDALRQNAAKLLAKFFEHVYVAPDGLEGLKIFRKTMPQIVITDIKMPNLDGMSLAKKIRVLNPKTKIIIMSAFDDKEFLYQAIEVGVFGYLKKPVGLNQLTETLAKAIRQILSDNAIELFHLQIQNIFNYQSAMIIMFKDEKPIIANQSFFDFFGIDSIEEFNASDKDIGGHFLEHDGFLYNTVQRGWHEEVRGHDQKLYHVKMHNHEGKIRHLLLKYQKVPNEQNVEMLSFDDVTELNLLKLFDEKATLEDLQKQDSQALFNLLEAIHRNGAKLQLYNYYKGLSITNAAIFTKVDERAVALKTNFMQQKAIQYEQRTLIQSEALPYVVEALEVAKLSFESQSVVLRSLRFVQRSAIQRETIRLVPEETHSVSLFINNSKYQGDVRIDDISLDGVKVTISALPAGLEQDMEIIIDMVLMLDRRPLIINTKAKLLRKVENKHNFSLVLLFDFKPGQRGELVKYMAKRQMAVIREFKGAQNG
jgi:CheY-like chemotaxis protein